MPAQLRQPDGLLSTYKQGILLIFLQSCQTLVEHPQKTVVGVFRVALQTAESEVSLLDSSQTDHMSTALL